MYFPPFQTLTALTGHHVHHLERRWWNCKDLLGLAGCDGGAVGVPVTGVVRFAEIGHAAPHAGYKVTVMFLTLTVRLQGVGGR